MIVKDSPVVIGTVSSKASNKSSSQVADEKDFPEILAKASPEKSVASAKEAKSRADNSSKTEESPNTQEPLTIPDLLTELAQLELIAPATNSNVKERKGEDALVDSQNQALQKLVTQSVRTVTAALQSVSTQADTKPALSGENGLSTIPSEKQVTSLQLSPLEEMLPSVQQSAAQPVESLKAKVDHQIVHSAIESEKNIDGLSVEQHDAFIAMINKAEGNIHSKENSMLVLKPEMIVPGSDSHEKQLLTMSELGLHPTGPTIHELAEKPTNVSQGSSVLLNQVVGTPAWQQALGHQLSYFSRNGTLQNAELRLHPEELGMIKINLSMKNDQVQLHFLTENHQVSAALDAAMPHLRTSLAESGISLGQSSISADLASSQHFSSQSERSAHSAYVEDEGQENAQVVEDNEQVITRTIYYSRGINTFV